MTRTQAARQLLALGPMSFGEFVTVTGWPIPACRRVLSYLVDDLGEAVRRGRLYLMTDANQLPNLQPLATQVRPSNGETPSSPLRSSPAMGIPATASDLRETQPGCCGRCKSSDRVEQQGVSAAEVPYLFATFEVRGMNTKLKDGHE